MSKALQIARFYFNAWRHGQFNEAFQYLSENLTIETPINHYADRQSFMEAVRYTQSAIQEVTLICELGDGDKAVLLYDMTIERLGNVRIVEQFDVHNGKIICLRQVHDTGPFRSYGFQLRLPGKNEQHGI